MARVTTDIREHWDEVAQQDCMVCKMHPVELHHVHGGSCKGLSGMGMRSNDWLVIPLCFHHHRGAYGIDNTMGVQSWEEAFGSQIVHLVNLAARLRVNVFANAGVDLGRLFAAWCHRE